MTAKIIKNKKIKKLSQKLQSQPPYLRNKKNGAVQCFLIENNSIDIRSIKEMLTGQGAKEFYLRCTRTLANGLRGLSRGNIDIILLTLDLPDSKGLAAFHKVYSLAPNVPIIILTGLDDENTALTLIQEGAQDCISKVNLNDKLLQRSIRYAIERGKTLERNNAETNAIFDNSPVPMLLLDQNANIIKASHTALISQNRINSNTEIFHIGEALRCINHLRASKGCGFGPACKNCKMREIIKDTIKTGVSHSEEEVSITVDYTGGRTRIYHFIVSTKHIKIHNSITILISLQDVTKRKEIETALKNSEEKFSKAFRLSPYMILITAVDSGKIIEANEEVVEKLEIPLKELIGKTTLELNFWKNIKDRSKYIQILLNHGKVRNFEASLRSNSGNILSCLLSAESFQLEGKQCMISIVNDITDRKKMEESLKNSKLEMEHKNIALNEIIGQIEIEKKKLEDNVTQNVEKVLLPTLKKLKLKGESRMYAHLLECHLRDIVSSYGKEITKKQHHLAPRELEVCNMIKEGLANKEIAKLLNISIQTVEVHRRNIRRKIGISNKPINLTSHLKTY